MQGHNTNAQELFEELQIQASTTADSDNCAPTSNCGASHSLPLEKLPPQLNWDEEMEKLFAMAASMRLAAPPRGTKNTSPSSKPDLPAPVRYCRANRKMAAENR